MIIVRTALLIINELEHPKGLHDSMSLTVCNIQLYVFHIQNKILLNWMSGSEPQPRKVELMHMHSKNVTIMSLYT